MPDVSLPDVVAQLIAVLNEGMEGSPHAWSYFTDSGCAAGLWGTLEKLTAEQASQPIGGTSIAAHVHHTAFAFRASAGWIRGERVPHDWKQSWSVSTVDAAAWSALLSQLGSDYADLRQAIETHATSTNESLGGAIGAIAHLAYHLAAIRQKVATGS